MGKNPTAQSGCALVADEAFSVRPSAARRQPDPSNGVTHEVSWATRRAPWPGGLCVAFLIEVFAPGHPGRGCGRPSGALADAGLVVRFVVGLGVVQQLLYVPLVLLVFVKEITDADQ